MKKGLVLVAVISILTVGNVFAHDAGDLMMHIEPQFGLSIPTFTRTNDEITDYKSSAVGLEFGLTVQAHYWFLDMLGANVGVGFNMGFDTVESSGHVKETWLGYTLYEYDFKQTVLLTRAYITVPFGVRFNTGVFVVGAGLSYNLPLGTALYAATTTTDGGGSDSDSTDFKLKDYLGWYVDIGFDTSGNKDAGGGFGMVLRLAGGLGEADNYSDCKYIPFSISLVFSPAIQLTNFNSGN